MNCLIFVRQYERAKEILITISFQIAFHEFVRLLELEDRQSSIPK